MKLVPFNVKEIAGRTYKSCANQKVIEEFRDSSMECAKIEDFTQKDAHSCANALNTAAKRMHAYTVKAIVRKGNVYLIKVMN